MLKGISTNTFSIQEKHKPVINHQMNRATAVYKSKNVNILDRDIFKQDIQGWVKFGHQGGRRAKAFMYKNMVGKVHK